MTDLATYAAQYERERLRAREQARTLDRAVNRFRKTHPEVSESVMTEMAALLPLYPPSGSMKMDEYIELIYLLWQGNQG